MKGRQLTLEEVLNLKDGTKVWVENPYYEGEVNYFMNIDTDMPRISKSYNTQDVFYGIDTFEKIRIYEWIKKPKVKYSMATEICNLRGIDLTDDNINKIMKEFEVK